MRAISGLLVTAALVAAAPTGAQQPAPVVQPGLTPAVGGGIPAGSPLAETIVAPELLKIRTLQERWVELNRTKNQQRDEVRKLQTLYGADAPIIAKKQEELSAIEEELARTEATFLDQLAVWKERVQGPGRILLKPVVVDLKNATLRQAAEALTKATQIPIQIDAQVPEETRLTLQARNVTLGAVVEAIGRQAGLKLSPAAGGLRIGAWPMVQVNGQQQTFKSSMAPWSADWGNLPGYQGRDGWVFPGEASAVDDLELPTLIRNFVVPGGVDPTPVVPSPAPQLVLPGGGGPTAGYPGGFDPAGGAPGVAPGGSPMGGGSGSRRTSATPALSFTSVGDRMLAVAESGRGPDGQSGAWITIYRIEGTGLKKIASGFHPVRAVRGSAPGAMPGMGSMGAPLPGTGSPFGGAPGSGALGVPGFSGAPTAVEPTPALTVPGLPGGLGFDGPVTAPVAPPVPTPGGAGGLPTRPAAKPVPTRAPAAKPAPAPMVEIRSAAPKAAPRKK